VIRDPTRPLWLLPPWCLWFIAGHAQAQEASYPTLPAGLVTVSYKPQAGIPTPAQFEASGTRIGEIRIRSRNVFDTSIPAEDTALFRLADRLHIQTRESTVRDQLLIHEGEPYRETAVAESERLLRRTRYLHDASIQPVAWRDGEVDLEVVTQDVWTLTPGLSFGRAGGENHFGFKLEELNLLGRGSQLSLGYESGVDRSSTTLHYRDSQLFGSWWSVNANFADSSDGGTREFTLEHPFYSLDTRYAAGLSALDEERVDAVYDLGKVTDQYGIQQRLATIYGGRSRGLRAGWTRRLTGGFTIDESRFTSVVTESGVTGNVPPDRRLVYPWLGYEWVQDRFATSRNLDQIERTEDVALGMRAQLRIGYSSPILGADRNAWILAASASRGFDFAERHRLMLAYSFNGRMEGAAVTDALSSLAAKYYFRESDHGVLYLGASVDSGSNLDLDHPVELGGDNGLRGYPLRYQRGEGRWLVTVEQRLFTDWFPFRLFNVGGAAFFDMGRTWGANPAGAPSQEVLKDVGLGLRLGNSRSALGNVLHLDIAFPLDGDPSIKKMQFLIETHRSF
jgi:outer membrane translocation and assembly module TamA